MLLTPCFTSPHTPRKKIMNESITMIVHLFQIISKSINHFTIITSLKFKHLKLWEESKNFSKTNSSKDKTFGDNEWKTQNWGVSMKMSISHNCLLNGSPRIGVSSFSAIYVERQTVHNIVMDLMVTFECGFSLKKQVLICCGYARSSADNRSQFQGKPFPQIGVRYLWDWVGIV